MHRIVILGAGGYLGGALCRFLHALPDISVTAIFHRDPGHSAFSDHLIADAFTDDWATKIAPGNISALFNCAFDFSAVGDRDYERKYAAFERNLAALRQCGNAKLINISTMSAYLGCRTNYGCEKLFIETLFSRYNGINVRPGLIGSWRYPGTAMLRLIDVTRNSTFFPLVLARGSGFFMCDLEAVVLGLFLLVGMKINKPHTLSFCYHDRLSLAAIERLIEKRYDIRRPKIPVPWFAAFLLLRLKELLVGKSKVRADSVIDFAYPAKTAYRREVFARLIATNRNALEAVSRSERTPNGFYFLEGRDEIQSRKSCQLTASIGEVQFARLGRLADA